LIGFLRQRPAQKATSKKVSSDHRLRWMVGAHLVWLFLVCLLGAWWGRLLLSQAAQLAALGSDLERWHRTQRMIYWESPVFFGLLLACSVLIFWMYWADVKRARGLQAFFASVTHELRTPLTSIRLQAESIAESLGDSHSEAPLVKRLLEDTLRLEAQVERTLELARLEGGGPVCNQPLQLKPWLNRWIKTWLQSNLGRVEVVFEVDDVWIEADPTALQIVFKNLFENALRHSGQELVKIEMSAHSSVEHKIQVTLRDNGRGYVGDPNSLGILFQKGPGSNGTGVGLYLVRTLVQRMKGEVSYLPGQGFGVALTFSEAQSHE